LRGGSPRGDISMLAVEAVPFRPEALLWTASCTGQDRGHKKSEIYRLDSLQPRSRPFNYLNHRKKNMTVRRIAGIPFVFAGPHFFLRECKKGRREIGRPRSNFVLWLTRGGGNQSDATRLLSRLILRATVFLWSTPRA